MENKKYIVYIDESNIISNIGHSVYVCLYIEFLNKDDISKNIVNIENYLNIPNTHWVNMPWKFRIKFAEKIKNIDFICKVVIYENPIFQKYILEDFLSKVVKNEERILKIMVDGIRSDKYIYKLKKKLKYKGFVFNRLIFVDDKEESLIRLADFLAGLLRSYVDNKNNNNTYIFNLLKHKIKTPD
jgi:hypothetical protein